MSSLSISPCHDHELTPNTAYTQDYFCYLHSHNHKSICECPFSVQCTFRNNWPPWAALHESWMVKSPRFIPPLASLRCEKNILSSQHAIHRLIPSTRPNSHGYCLPVHPQLAQVQHWISSITSSKYITKLHQLWPPGASPNPPNYSLQVCTIITSRCVYTLTSFWPPIASPNSLKHDLWVDFETCSITAFNSIS